MATMKKGILVRASEWWKHLRPYNKKRFWSRQRKAEKKDVLDRIKEERHPCN